MQMCSNKLSCKFVPIYLDQSDHSSSEVHTSSAVTRKTCDNVRFRLARALCWMAFKQSDHDHNSPMPCNKISNSKNISL